VDVTLTCGAAGRAAVPTASAPANTKPSNSATANKKRFGGKGVLKAVANANTKSNPRHRPGRAGSAHRGRTMIKLDGTETKSKLGANAISPSRSRTPSRFRRPRQPLFNIYLGGPNAKVLPVRLPTSSTAGALRFPIDFPG